MSGTYAIFPANVHVAVSQKLDTIDFDSTPCRYHCLVLYSKPIHNHVGRS